MSFKIGDKVIRNEYTNKQQRGTVISITDKQYDDYPIRVKFEPNGIELSYTTDGRRLSNMEPTLFPDTKLHRALA